VTHGPDTIGQAAENWREQLALPPQVRSSSSSAVVRRRMGFTGMPVFDALRPVTGRWGVARIAAMFTPDLDGERSIGRNSKRRTRAKCDTAPRRYGTLILPSPTSVGSTNQSHAVLKALIGHSTIASHGAEAE